MNKDYCLYLASQDLNSTDYKILLLLTNGVYTQVQIAQMLGMQRQNIHPSMKKLESMHLVQVDRIEGKNKFFKSITNADVLKNHIPGQTKLKF